MTTTAPGPVIVEATRADVPRCYPLFRELVNHIRQPTFEERVQRQMDDGYRILLIEEDGKPAAAVGFRQVTTLAWGRVLYLDDLVTRETSRGRGYASALIRHLKAVAVNTGCSGIHLNTAHHRYVTHRFYLARQFDIICHHMAWDPPTH